MTDLEFPTSVYNYKNEMGSAEIVAGIQISIHQRLALNPVHRLLWELGVVWSSAVEDATCTWPTRLI